MNVGNMSEDIGYCQKNVRNCWKYLRNCRKELTKVYKKLKREDTTVRSPPDFTITFFQLFRRQKTGFALYSLITT